MNFCVEPTGARGDFGLGNARAGAVDHCDESFDAVATFKRFEKRGAAGIFSGGTAGERVEDDASADGGDRGKLANDEAVAGQNENFVAEAEMSECGFTGRQFSCVIQVD